jgi:hypothetical protein
MVLGGIAFAVPPWLVKEAIPQLSAIQHVRHGFLDFSMQHKNILDYKSHQFRLDQMFKNGYSSNPKKDLFVLSIAKDGKIRQEVFEGKPSLEQYF